MRKRELRNALRFKDLRIADLERDVRVLSMHIRDLQMQLVDAHREDLIKVTPRGRR